MHDAAPGAHLHAAAVATLEQWRPSRGEQERLRTAYLEHLLLHPDGLSRTCHPDHITASALVVSADRSRVMLNLHAKYEIWVQFGGHCEAGDADLASAALREAIEESGIDDLVLAGPEPVQLSTHEVSCGPIRPSHHLDVRYLAVAAATAAPRVSVESVAIEWFRPGALPAGVDPQLRELIDAVTAGAGSR